MDSEQVTYEVKKVTTGIAFCKVCGGTGKTTARGSRTRSGKCIVCGGRGKTKITHETTVNLLDALKDLNLIKK